MWKCREDRRRDFISACRTSAAGSQSIANDSLRLLVQGDGKHLADAIQGLQSELRSVGITASVVSRGQAYDLMIIFGEGSRDAAAAVALDMQGNVVAVVVKGAFTEKGAADGVARDLAKKLSAISR